MIVIKKELTKNVVKVTLMTGYTLIEMAIAIIVIGLLLGSGLSLYSHHIQSKISEDTIINVSYSSDRIQSFRSNHGRYPCPAPLNVARTDPDYGKESDCNGAAISALNPGDCAGGICVEQGLRTVLPDSTPLTASERRVIVGALPFRSLQVDEDKTFDGYKNRILYSVSLQATSQTTFDESKGAITIHDQNGNPLTLIDGSVLFSVLSHGKNELGAYSNMGILVQPCAGTTLDKENCNAGFASGTGSTDSLYIASQESSALGTTYFDDTVNYFSQISSPAWRRTDSNIEDIQDLSNNFVGAGIAIPNAELDIDSSGATDSLRIYGTNKLDGEIKTDQICNENGTDCFDPIIITGDNSVSGEGMKCPSGEYMVGIENGGPICADEIEVKCDADITKPIMIGIDASGTPICIPAPSASCPTTSFDPCVNGNVISISGATDGTLKPGPSTSNFYATVFGDCRKVRYKCNAGTWSEYATGFCSFTPTSSTTHQTCKSYYGNQCGRTNNVHITSTTLCTGGSSSSVDTTSCGCQIDTCPKTVSCRTLLGPYYTNGPIVSYNEFSTCPGGPTGVPTVTNDLATADKSMCTCAESSRA
ncbi:MAG: hypothetical protein KDJ26_06285, partial [Alphaproteobacteria bacterium]|nr:hypothetical protein [Alphaproteobacteria bacterium]